MLMMMMIPNNMLTFLTAIAAGSPVLMKGRFCHKMFATFPAFVFHGSRRDAVTMRVPDVPSQFHIRRPLFTTLLAPVDPGGTVTPAYVFGEVVGPFEPARAEWATVGSVFGVSHLLR